jgi:hypothetical protein
MSLADELLADLEDDNDNEELQELINEKVKTEVKSDDEGEFWISIDLFSMSANLKCFCFRQHRRW